MQKSVPGLAFPFPGQSFVMGNQPTQMRNVMTLMLIPMLIGQAGQLFCPIEADLTRSQQFRHIGSLLQLRSRPTHASGGLMRHIRSSRSPIHDRPIPISQM